MIEMKYPMTNRFLMLNLSKAKEELAYRLSREVGETGTLMEIMIHETICTEWEERISALNEMLKEINGSGWIEG